MKETSYYDNVIFFAPSCSSFLTAQSTQLQNQNLFLKMVVVIFAVYHETVLLTIFFKHRSAKTISVTKGNFSARSCQENILEIVR